MTFEEFQKTRKEGGGADPLLQCASVQELRKATGLTQQAFSEKFGIPKRTIQQWEGSKRAIAPYLLELLIFANYF